ncbi:MAG: hypothetical protein ACLQU6_17920, partial [Limisphaerales bacterium]
MPFAKKATRNSKTGRRAGFCEKLLLFLAGCGSGLGGLGFYQALLKFIHAPGGVHELLLREGIIKIFPIPDDQQKSSKQWISDIDEIYKQDAYNSLSIEGYEVTEELIEKVRNNHWNLDLSAEDSETRNALAARGYYEAFKEVKNSILKMLEGADPAETLERDLSKWYQNLFAPSVRAQILNPIDVIGYRK